MSPEQQMVRDFQQMCGQTVQEVPAAVSYDDRDLRIALVQEECGELEEALWTGDLVGIAHELADLLYVVYGTAVTYGIDMAPIFAEVHRANLSKRDGTRRTDGKWVKGTYSPANLVPLLEAQAGARPPVLGGAL